MSYITAERILQETGYTDEERRLARLRLIQRELFPGDEYLLTDEPIRLTVPIGEVIAWQSGRSA